MNELCKSPSLLNMFVFIMHACPSRWVSSNRKQAKELTSNSQSVKTVQSKLNSGFDLQLCSAVGVVEGKPSGTFPSDPADLTRLIIGFNLPIWPLLYPPRREFFLFPNRQ